MDETEVIKGGVIFMEAVASVKIQDMYHCMFKEYPDVLSFEDMCNVLSISSRTGYKLLSKNKIQAMKVGRAFKIPKIFVIDFLAHKDKKD